MRACRDLQRGWRPSSVEEGDEASGARGRFKLLIYLNVLFMFHVKLIAVNCNVIEISGTIPSLAY